MCYAADGAGENYSLAGKRNVARKIRMATTERTPNITLNPHVPCIQATNVSVNAIIDSEIVPMVDHIHAVVVLLLDVLANPLAHAVEAGGVEARRARASLPTV